jgi:outer membrane murein-binding lipoprotein Lpp
VNDLFLGLIALAVLVMAGVQVAAIVFAARTARNVGEAVSRLERDVRPIVTNLQSISADAARATAAASAQVERVQKTLDAVLERVDTASVRVEQTLQTIQEGILIPAREGFGLLQMIRSLFSSGGGTRRAPRPRPTPADDEDALFIG